jgi:hypothetical protein
MRYELFTVNGTPPASETFNVAKGKSIRFEKTGGTLSDADVGALKAAYQKNGQWQPDTLFMRAVVAGLIKITGDRELEQSFKSKVPEVQKPVRKEKGPSVEALGEQIATLQKQMAEMLKASKAKKAE